MNILLETLVILTGIFSSIISSFMFLIVLRLLKPKIIISDKITHNPIIDNVEGGYTIKVINQSRRSVVSIRAQFSLIRPKLNTGHIIKAQEVSLVNGDPLIIAAFKRGRNFEYAFRFRTLENLLELLQENSNYLFRFRIICYDSFSNFGKVFEQEYKVSDIVEGYFVDGDTFNINMKNTGNFSNTESEFGIADINKELSSTESAIKAPASLLPPSSVIFPRPLRHTNKYDYEKSDEEEEE